MKKKRFLSIDNMNDEKRIAWLKIIIAASFFIGIIIANHLWFGARLYPKSPVVDTLKLLPAWTDDIAAALLLCGLVLIAFSKNPKRYIVAVLALCIFLIAEDQGRLFPSFYEYIILLFIFAACSWKKERRDVSRNILNVCRFGVALIYFWSGMQKINPFFEGQISWVMLPILQVFPALRGGFIGWAGIIAPLVEIEIGIALLFKKTRNAALIEALFMHAALFFLIGPWRNPWNAGAWAWNLASGFIVFILFFRTENIAAKEIIFPKHGEKYFAYGAAMIFFGILPGLNFINIWDSSASFNVYSGNVARGEIYVNKSAVKEFPAGIQKYIDASSGSLGSYYFLDLNAWSENELRAEPYPAPRIFKDITRSLCSYAASGTDVRLVIHEKLSLFEEPNFLNDAKRYDCAALLQ